jgi:uncharacterized protein (TIGR00369 family)
MQQIQGVPSELKAIFEILEEMYTEKIPFNKVLGISVTDMSPDAVRVEFPMRDDLIGNFTMKSLHGGVISSVLDLTGGLMASTGVLNKMVGRPLDEIKARLTRVGTIDLRVDYLRPGRGKFFIASASIMRTGNKVAVTRIEFHNDENLLIAVGTGTYLVG